MASLLCHHILYFSLNVFCHYNSFTIDMYSTQYWNVSKMKKKENNINYNFRALVLLKKIIGFIRLVPYPVIPNLFVLLGIFKHNSKIIIVLKKSIFFRQKEDIEFNSVINFFVSNKYIIFNFRISLFENQIWGVNLNFG